MPFLYVYSPSDFVTAPPAESGGAASGSGPFTLQLAPGAVGTIVEVSDNDTVFHEIDSTQSITSDIDLDGTSYSAGTSVHAAYDLINTSTGHKVTSLHFGGNGYQQGSVQGIVSTVKFEPGQTYTFNLERTSYRQNNQYSEYVACFADDVSILTSRGDVAAIDLRSGDLVETVDMGTQPLRLKLTRSVSAETLKAQPNLRPICITAGSLGNGLPRRDLRVSPQHRMLVSGPICERMFGEASVLLSARKMCVLPGVYEDTSGQAVTYVHLVFDAHQLVYAEGAPSESFFCGEHALEGLTEEARREYLALFPDRPQAKSDQQSVRQILPHADERDLVKRLGKNGKALLKNG